jgi:hypothetical protein
MPEDSERFCFNICPGPNYKKDDPKTVVLYHFNPRIGWGKNNVLQNHFVNGQWGRADRSIQNMPISKGRRFQLIISINPTGFDVFVDGKWISTFGNRCDSRFLQPSETLYVVVPPIEEYYGDDEVVVVNRVWWGYTSIGAGRSGVGDTIIPGYVHRNGGESNGSKGTNGRSVSGGGDLHSETASSNYGGESQKQLYVEGLPTDDALAWNEVLRLFEKYGIVKDKHSGEPLINNFDKRGFAFVTLETAKSCDEAIKDLHGRSIGVGGGTLKVSRSRSSKDSKHGGHLGYRR